MSRFTNLVTTTDEFEENESDDMCVSDEDQSKGGEDDSEDQSEGDEDDSEGQSEDGEDESEDQSEGGEDDSEGQSEGGEDESEDQFESGEDDSEENHNLWTVHFHSPPAQQFQSSRKCSGLLPSSPVQTFRRLFTDDVFNLIHEQTNIYGRQKYQKTGDMTNWTDITKLEIEQFLGINVIMGYCRNPSVDSYWSTDASFRNEKISTSMSRTKFKRILQNLHLVDNSKVAKTEKLESNKLYKVLNFLELLVHNFQTQFDLGEQLTVDEMMIKFKGRSSFKQYIKEKPIKRGYKVWVLADASTGYVYNFEIYVGKSVERQVPLGEHVVWSLTRELSMKYHHIYFDNFFTSPSLVERLLEDGIYCTGTVRKTRRGIPAEITRDIKMARGDVKFLAKNSISVLKWMDRKPVYVMSNFSDPTEVTKITRKLKNGHVIPLDCPVMIQDYNYGKVGVDRADQRIHYYAVDRKSNRNWLRIFFHFFNVALSNAFVIYHRDHPNDNMTYLQFLAIIAEQLIGCRSSVNKRKGRPVTNFGVKKRKKGERKISISNEIRFSNVGVHLPIPTSRRRCAYCSTKNNEQRSSIECSTCKVALCVSNGRNCFYLFHTN